MQKSQQGDGTVWGIAERKSGDDWNGYIMVFDSLIKNVLMSGVEMWQKLCR